MARQKQTATPKAEETVKADADSDIKKATDTEAAQANDANTEAGAGSLGPSDAGKEDPQTSAEQASAEPKTDSSTTEADPLGEKTTKPPEETASPAEKTSAGLSHDEANAFLETVLGTKKKENRRRFVVLKPVRFNGKRIPRAGRLSVTRAGHDELASLGAVSPIWDHGTAIETE
ncbi:hypothetical protein K7H91_11950 [Martelella mediterranea]|nr:hypothetical protein [Martelella mediterranea]